MSEDDSGTVPEVEPSQRPAPLDYVIQIALFVVFVAAVDSVFELVHHVVVASLAASAFVVFAMPSSAAASPVNIVAGQGLGYLIGLSVSLVPVLAEPYDPIAFAFAAGVTFAIMVRFKIAHPPGVATAFGVSISSAGVVEAATFALAICLLAACHRLVGHRLKPLI